MIEKVVNKTTLAENADQSADVKYWLSRPAAERFAAVDFLRHQAYGDVRLQRVITKKTLSQKA